jgi:hypothetical protein
MRTATAMSISKQPARSTSRHSARRSAILPDGDPAANVLANGAGAALAGPRRRAQDVCGGKLLRRNCRPASQQRRAPSVAPLAGLCYGRA